jgi:hypothetical protein
LLDPVTGLTFMNFNNPADLVNPLLSAADKTAGGRMFQTNLILPEPRQFLRPDLPAYSVMRPTRSQQGGPLATVNAFVADNLFAARTLNSSTNSDPWRQWRKRHSANPARIENRIRTASGRRTRPACRASRHG